MFLLTLKILPEYIPGGFFVSGPFLMKGKSV
jgi:hypothetical protein